MARNWNNNTQATKTRHADGIDNLMALLPGVLSRYSLILTTTGLVVLCAMAYIIFATPLYSASTKILIDPREKKTVANDLYTKGFGTNFPLVDSQIKVVRSDAILHPVIKALGLTQDEEFVPPPTILSRVVGAFTSLLPKFGSRSGFEISPEVRRLNLATDILQDKLSVKRLEQTYVLEISVTTEQALKSAEISDTIAKTYLEDQSEDKSNAAKKVGKLMGGRLDELSRNLREAENAVEEFKAQHDLQATKGELIDLKQLELLNEQFNKAKEDAAAAKAEYDWVKGLVRNGVEPGQLGDRPLSPTISRLREQYAQASSYEASLRSQLLPGHPRLIRAKARVQRMRNLVIAEVKRGAEAIKTRYDIAQQKLSEATRRLNAAKARANAGNANSIKLRELQRRATTTRNVYESFLARVKEMSEQQRIETPDARIISSATIPEKASWPKKALILLASIVSGLLLGLGLAFIAEYLQGVPVQDADARTATHLPLAGVLPWLEQPESKGGFFALPEHEFASLDQLAAGITNGAMSPPDSFGASVRRLLRRIIRLDITGQIIAITSSTHGEGKTATAWSLAHAASNAGIRVLYVVATDDDVELTRALQNRPLMKKALANAQSQNGAPKKKVRLDTSSGISFMKLPKSVKESLGRPGGLKNAQKLRAIAENFDLTLVDCDPVFLDWSVAGVVSQADVTLFLIKSGTTPADLAASASQETRRLARRGECLSVVTMAEPETARSRAALFGTPLRNAPATA